MSDPFSPSDPRSEAAREVAGPEREGAVRPDGAPLPPGEPSLEPPPELEAALGPEKAALLAELNHLTLPLMWSIRQDAVRAFEPLDVRPMKAVMLGLVQKGLVHPKELAEVLESAPPAISAMISDLEERGVLRRETDPDDRRRVLLQITDEGEALLAEIERRWHAVGSERLRHLDARDLHDLIRVYRKMLEASWS